MSLIQNTQLGAGGAGFQGSDANSAAAMLKELQGLNVSLVTGGAQDTKFEVAAIRPEDTILAALNNNAGTISDVTGTMSIVDLRASGTITVGAATAGHTVVVAGLTYTLVASDAVVAAMEYQKVKIGGTTDATAANLAAAINARESARAQQVAASVVGSVVTITAVAEGTAGNSIALVETGNTFTISGATLAGGSATGGVKSSGATNQIILFWFNKR